MAAKSGRQRSLFGGFEPEPRDPRGRKRIAWHKQTAEKIVLLSAQRRTQEEIAAEVGLSVKTLGRIYADELSEARERLRRAVFEVQVRRATEAGSTPAARFVLAELAKHDLEDGPYRAPTAATRAKPLGKKEQRQADAAQVGGLYAPGAPPRLTSH